MDFNQHMKNAAFLGCAEETRMRYLESRGWTMQRFQEAQLGPVVLEDKLNYRHELRLLEPFSVDLAVAAATADGRRMKVRNRFIRDSDAAVCAVVESVVVWFDIRARALVQPPDHLRDAFLQGARTDDFEAWTSQRPT